MKKLDRRRKYYLILDCETATLSCVQRFNECERKKIALAKPLIYDIGWVICDRRGHIYDRKSYLVSEIFSNYDVFSTAFYSGKRPLYIEKLKQHKITLESWIEIAKVLVEDAQKCVAVGAYNSMFDFKKAIPFTQNYIKHFYSNNFMEWIAEQEKLCIATLQEKSTKKSQKFDSNNFQFLGKTFPLFDVWAIACNTVLNTEKYKEYCVKNNGFTNTGKFFSTTAENVFRFLSHNDDFDEEHTALSDAEIEAKIFGKIVNRSLKNLEMGIQAFPFRKLGTVQEYTQRAAALAL